jgi:hypothetical protein
MDGQQLRRRAGRRQGVEWNWMTFFYSVASTSSANASPPSKADVRAYRAAAN